MFFIYVADGPEESLLLSSLGPAASITTLLCVVVVTVALVLLMLMCVCSKETTSVRKLQNDSAPTTENENGISFGQLSKTEDIESQLTDENKEETKNGDLSKAVPENCSLATSVTQPAMVQLKEENRPTRHTSPSLPPRNPHNFHASVNRSNQPSASVQQASSRASTPASLEKFVDVFAANQTSVDSATATENVVATKNSWPPTCRVQPDYEEVDLPEKPEPSANSKVDECDDTNIYQDIDLDQGSKSQPTTVKNSDSIEPYAEYKENSKKSSAIERPQSKATSVEMSESEAPIGSQSANEIPRYAKVDKSSKSLVVPSDSSLANHLPEDGLTSPEAAISTGEPKSSEHKINVTELYTQVHKPLRNVVSCENGKDSHVSESQEGVKCENSEAVNGEMVLNPCYATTMMRNYQSGTTSGHDYSEPSEVRVPEEPDYSTVNDERVTVTQNPDPGYSSIYETQHVYSEISLANSQGQGGAEAAANAAGNSSTDLSKAAKEPIYELVEATPRDEASNQRL